MNTLDDYKVWDNTEAATLETFTDRTSDGDAVNLSVTKWTALTRRELQSPLLVLVGDELGVSLPVALLEGKTPKTGDVLTRTEESNTKYLIKGEPQLLHAKSRWRCIVSKART